jgi:hypothetical protein
MELAAVRFLGGERILRRDEPDVSQDGLAQLASCQRAVMPVDDQRLRVPRALYQDARVSMTAIRRDIPGETIYRVRLMT